MAFFLSFNLVDVVIVVAALISGVMATNRGFIREALGLVGWVVSILMAGWCDGLVVRVLEDAIESERLAAGVAWFIPFFVIAVGWFVMANISTPTLRHFTLGLFDRPLGFFFGVVRGFVLAVLFYIGLVVAAEGEDGLPRMVGNAALVDQVRSAAIFLASLAPDSIRDTITDNIPATHIDSDDVDEFNERLEGPLIPAVPSEVPAVPSPDGGGGNLLPDELQENPLIYDTQ